MNEDIINEYGWDLNEIKSKYTVIKMNKYITSITRTPEDEEIMNSSTKVLKYLSAYNTQEILNYFQIDNPQDIFNILNDPMKLEKYFSMYNSKETIDNSNTKRTQLEMVNNNTDVLNIHNFRDIYYEFVLSEITTNEFSLDDSVEIANEFYKHLDKEHYKYFLEFYKDRYNLLQLSNCSVSQTYHVPYYDKSYIEIKENSKDKDLPISLIHELGHYINARMNKYNTLMKKKDLGEVDSIFFEFLACDFLQKNIPNYKNGSAIKERSFGLLLCNCMKISQNLSNPQFLKEYGKKSGLLNNTEHCISFPYSIEFYELYKKDPDKAMNILNKFIYCDYNQSQKELLKSNNIIPFEHMNDFQKSLELGR